MDSNGTVARLDDTTQRRNFGNVRQLKSGKWQVRWKLGGKWYSARLVDKDGYDIGAWTFSTEKQAEDHLTWVGKQIEMGRWHPPDKRPATGAPVTLRDFAEDWLEHRDIKPSTRQSYRGLLDRLILPKLGDKPLTDIDQETVERWWSRLPDDKPVYRAHAYQLLHTILSSAKKLKHITEVPSIERAGRSKRKRQVVLLEPSEVTALAAAMPEPYGVMVLLSARCALRFGEVTALTKADVDLKRGVLHVRRGVTRTRGHWNVSTPKSGVGRSVDIPASLLPVVKRHISGLKPDALLFPAKRGDNYLHAPNFNRLFRVAAEAIGRPDVRVHDLRHYGLVRFAMTGASLSEIMERGGHLTVSAAQQYFHVARGRQAELTGIMDEMENGNVVRIESAKRRSSKRAATK